MADINYSANMNLPIPVVGVQSGPEYASNINAALTLVDTHDHSPGYGVPITPAGMDINVDLDFNSNFATAVAGIVFDSQLATPGTGTVYLSGVDLYFVDGLGNNIQITANGGVAGAPGSISNLVSPASAAYVAGNSTLANIYELLNREEIAADPILLRAAESLLDLPPLSSWQLPQEAALPLVEKVQGLGESRLVLSRASQFERVDQLMREGAGEIFTPALRQYYRRLLEEAALLFWQEEQVQEARRALAAAIDLEREVGRLTENTFVLGLLKRALGEALREQQGEDEETGEERTTESGLIIPGR